MAIALLSRNSCMQLGLHSKENHRSSSSSNSKEESTNSKGSICNKCRTADTLRFKELIHGCSEVHCESIPCLGIVIRRTVHSNTKCVLPCCNGSSLGIIIFTGELKVGFVDLTNAVVGTCSFHGIHLCSYSVVAWIDAVIDASHSLGREFRCEGSLSGKHFGIRVHNARLYDAAVLGNVGWDESKETKQKRKQVDVRRHGRSQLSESEEEERRQCRLNNLREKDFCVDD
mmetsp:Transcript_16749/g.27186  ORF Transcript_16749/g.27186 Transcript_16749/m.27186 type:complete len:229 (+) Transcript_16749:157-843(+)